jgi:predicted TIM-barrel fold metal-dependent hydrolase
VVFDCHCHIVPPEMATDPAAFAGRDPHFAEMCRTKNAKFLTGKDLIRDMSADGVDRAVVFGFAFKDCGISRLQNDYALDIAARNPGKLLAMAVLDPESPGALAEAERCLSLGACGVGEVFPAGHGFDLCGTAMKKVAGLCREAGVPVLIHVSELVGHEYPGKGDVGPLAAYRFAAENPGLTIIYAHLGGGLPFYAAMPEIRALQHVYYDNAAQPFLYKPNVYLGLKGMGILDKILLGSDYPLISCKRYIRDLENSGLKRDDQELVLRENAEMVFGSFFTGRSEGN